MTDRMQVLSNGELTLIHDTSVEILADTGMNFNSEHVLDIFQHHGFKTDGTRVFITEKELRSALETVPSRFTIHARNPANNVTIGEDDFVFLPTGGAPNVVTAEGEMRPATLADYHNCCRLVQTSDQLDMNGMLMVQPTDIPAQVAHLDMLFADMALCDKAYVGTAMSRQSTSDCLEMAAIGCQGKENLKHHAVIATIVHAMSPLKFSADEAEAIIAMARMRQPLVITNMVMAGTSGPVSLPGLLALAQCRDSLGIGSGPTGLSRHSGGIWFCLCTGRHAHDCLGCRRTGSSGPGFRHHPIGPVL